MEILLYGIYSNTLSRYFVYDFINQSWFYFGYCSTSKGCDPWASLWIFVCQRITTRNWFVRWKWKLSRFLYQKENLIFKFNIQNIYRSKTCCDFRFNKKTSLAIKILNLLYHLILKHLFQQKWLKTNVWYIQSD